MGIPYEIYSAGLRAISKLVGQPFTYAQDGLYTVHNADFLTDPRFASANAQAMATNHGHGSRFHIEWRVYVCCWAASHALHHDGDFVECGVHSGMYSRAVVDYVGFDRLSDRHFYLLDTFEAIPKDQYLPDEVDSGLNEFYKYPDIYASTKRTFEAFSNVTLVRGRVPETLSQVPSQKVTYLSIDMNAVAPEIAAAEFFWDKLVSGGVIVLDDYGFPRHIAQKRAFDRFTAERGVSVLSLPTGQGVIFKP